jgi:hypothetical protein
MLSKMDSRCEPKVPEEFYMEEHSSGQTSLPPEGKLK